MFGLVLLVRGSCCLCVWLELLCVVFVLCVRVCFVIVSVNIIVMCCCFVVWLFVPLCVVFVLLLCWCERVRVLFVVSGACALCSSCFVFRVQLF